MSTKDEGQTTLADFNGQQSATEDKTSDKKKATPEDESDASTDNQTEVKIVIDTNNDSRTCCETCGEPVSDDFAAIFGDRNGNVHACLECSTRHELRSGAGANLDRSNGEKTVSLMDRERGQHAPDEV